MNIELTKVRLPWREGGDCHAFLFLPDPTVELKPALGLITHGYTSHKGPLLNWAARLAEEGMASVLFDLPGHYLGGFCEVQSLSVFQDHAHQLFEAAHQELCAHLHEARPLDHHILEEAELVLMGHSLGGLLSLKALKLPTFASKTKQAICVGLGLPPIGKTHLFSSSFYKSTLHLRAQLVSKALDPDQVFPWIKKAKEELTLGDQKIHFITGQDDLVVAEDGTERFAELLKVQGNQVSIERPTKLPHHQPELAAGHIKKYLKDLLRAKA